MTTPATPTGTITVSIPNADGSITNLTATLAGGQITTTPPPAIIPPPPPATGEPVIPSNAVVVDMLPFAFASNHDAGTPGSATGTTTYPVTAPDGTPNCREFQMTLIAKGGYIYHGDALKDSSAFNTFCYETDEFFPDPSNLQQMEKDLEQVDATGSYVDMATQLNGNAGCLDITANSKWQHTPVKANPTAIAPATWYPTQRFFRNNGDGTVTYIGSKDNGTYSPLNITVNSKKPGPWGKNILNVQYQFDGKSSGSVQSTVYARVFRIHCWKT
jgi:hypothetical protein